MQDISFTFTIIFFCLLYLFTCNLFPILSLFSSLVLPFFQGLQVYMHTCLHLSRCVGNNTVYNILFYIVYTVQTLQTYGYTGAFYCACTCTRKKVFFFLQALVHTCLLPGLYVDKSVDIGKIHVSVHYVFIIFLSIGMGGGVSERVLETGFGGLHGLENGQEKQSAVVVTA